MMNNRKRIDGHYESTNRSLQNSKYSNSRYFNNYYRDRDPSPKRVAHRSVSPEGSPRERYQSSSYRSKERDREYNNKKDKYSEKRNRDRELEYKNYAKKSKVRERSSSDEEHKDNDRFYEKSRYAERDSLRRGSLPEKERTFGNWKEMISKGSGKKYYYNERDKSSQWEKPEEWVEYDLMAAKEYQSRGYREKDRDRKSGRDDRYNNSRSRYHDKHSIRTRWPNDPYPSTSSSHYKRDENADMDISPESTPSEPSYASPTANNSNLNCNSNHDDLATSPNGHHSKSSSSYLSQQNHHHHQLGNSSSGNVSNSNRLLHSNSKSSSTIAVSSPSTHNPTSHYSSSHRNRSMTPETNNDANSHHNSLSLRNSPSNNNNNNINSNSLPNHSVSRSDSSNQLIGDGPPTPEMDLNNTSDHNNRRLDSTSGMHSLQSVMSSVTQTSNRLNLLTPSLSKFFRPDLITHVTNWPAESLEKQAQKIAEEVYLHGDLECCRISAEIQCARSIVRVTEIAATIQTQRRLFLKEQVQESQTLDNNSSSAITF